MTGRLLLVAALAVAALAPPAPARAGVPADFSEITRIPGTSTYPDARNTRIYEAAFRAGGRAPTAVIGRVPRARFVSFAVQDAARREIDVVGDVALPRGRGRPYRIAVRSRCARRAPRCLEVPAHRAPVRFVYRVYAPERDDCGGVGIPLVVRGRPRAGSTGRCPRRAPDVDTALARLAPLAGPVGADAVGPPPRVVRYRAGGGAGGTADNAYLVFGYDLTRGDVLVTARAPTYRAQAARAANRLGRADGSEQVRYWSLCTTAFSRPVDCRRDEEVPVDRRGRFRAVIAARCPAPGARTCLRAGPSLPTPAVSALLGALAGGGAANAFVYRNLLPRRPFALRGGPDACPPRRPVQFCGEHELRVRYVARS